MANGQQRGPSKQVASEGITGMTAGAERVARQRLAVRLVGGGGRQWPGTGPLKGWVGRIHYLQRKPATKFGIFATVCWNYYKPKFSSLRLCALFKKGNFRCSKLPFQQYAEEQVFLKSVIQKKIYCKIECNFRQKSISEDISHDQKL